jgi:hypothetical protein
MTAEVENVIEKVLAAFQKSDKRPLTLVWLFAVCLVSALSMMLGIYLRERTWESVLASAFTPIGGVIIAVGGICLMAMIALRGRLSLVALLIVIVTETSTSYLVRQLNRAADPQDLRSAESPNQENRVDHVLALDKGLPRSFSVTSPSEGGVVARSEQIRGTTPYVGRQHYIVVTTPTSGDVLQDAPVSISEAGTLAGRAIFGNASVGEGEFFVVRFLATNVQLDAASWRVPEDAIFSSAITVSRKQ